MSFAIAKKKSVDNVSAEKRTRHNPQDKSSSPIWGSPLSSGKDVLQRKASCVCGGSCPKCLGTLGIQPKLKIGTPNDVYEQEADRVADQVMAMSSNTNISSTPPQIQRLTEHATGRVNTTVPTSVDRVLASSGRPMDSVLQQEMGQRFGQDFSRVRIHTDTIAEQSTRDVGAHAYTVGQNVVFGAGQFSPRSQVGRRLIAHELTHVVQQSKTSSKNMLQKKSCNFYVFDNTAKNPPGIAKIWRLSAKALALGAHGGYAISSGDTIEYMLSRLLRKYDQKDCDCIEEVQFLSHGSSGNGMYISKTGDEITSQDFNIPGLEKFGKVPNLSSMINNPSFYKAWRSWFKKLSWRHQLMVQMRNLICRSDAEIYYRSCSAFQGEKGKDFAEKSASFWQTDVVGHTKLIGLTQPGKKTLSPNQKPFWLDSEGLTTEMKKRGSKAKKYRNDDEQEI